MKHLYRSVLNFEGFLFSHNNREYFKHEGLYYRVGPSGYGRLLNVNNNATQEELIVADIA